MVNISRRETSRDATPPRNLETTPPAYTSYDPSFILQSVLEMQKNLGQLTQTVTTLTEESKKQGTLLNKISHKVFAAEVVIGIVGAILALVGYRLFNLLGKIWDVMSPIIQIKPHP